MSGARPPRHVCPSDWPGSTVFLVASGPSTVIEDLKLLEGAKIIGVAHGYRALQKARMWFDVLVVGGRAFYHHNRLSEIPCGLIVAAQDYASWHWLTQRDQRLVCMDRAGRYGLTDRRDALAGSESSVMLAINYAVHRGARRVVLLGCDGQPGPDGRRRIGVPQLDTGDARSRYMVQERAMQTQIEPLRELGIEIVNCSPGTALTIYPTADLVDVLEGRC
jgi:hypothetical protein